MTSIQHLVRDNVKNLSAYSSARSLYQSGILLDANENPISLVETVQGVENDLALNRYPDGSNKALRNHFASYFGVGADMVATGNGSDELIDLLIRIFCRPQIDSIFILPPTFSMYSVSAKMNEVGIKEFIDPDFKLLDFKTLPVKLPVSKILNFISYEKHNHYKGEPLVKIIFICNPNNPTGTSFTRESILELVKASHSIIVVDEAYGEFMVQESLLNEVKNFPNLVVLKTLSKAYALAGLRLGISIASEEITSLIQKVKFPYNINSLTTQTFLNLVDYANRVKENVAYILNEKRRFADNLSKIALVEKIFPSEGSFFLVQFHDSGEVFNKLVEMGIITRKVEAIYGMDNCLRISIGNPPENDELINVLKEMERELNFH